MTLDPGLGGDFLAQAGEVRLDGVAPDADLEPAPSPKPKRHRRGLVPRTLSSRLVAGVVALVLGLVVLIGGATYFSLRYFLFQRLDQQLNSTSVQNANLLGQCIPRGNCTTRLFGPAPTQSEWMALLNADGSLFGTLGPNPYFANLTLSDPAAADLAEHPGLVKTVTSDGVELRVTARVVGTHVFVTGLETREVDRTLGQLFFLELVIGGTAVILAFLTTTYGVRASLRNLYRVTDTAQEVAAELSPDGAGLDRRVPVVEEGSEIGALAESMNTLLAAVETQFAARLESERRMRQFLADASHELRTPLTSIRGYAELARMQRAAGNVDEDNISRIEAEGTRMSRLVEDLLMLARGDQDAVPRVELVDVAELLDDVVSASRAGFPHRQIELVPSPSYHVVGDPDQLLRAVRNLVANAAVHTDPNAPIRLQSFVDGPGVAIQVVDGGPGLAPDEAAHVFERFWRADKARTRARGGSGLGLAIVASIVQAHAGTVHFASAVEQGSTVTIWLPGVSS